MRCPALALLLLAVSTPSLAGNVTLETPTDPRAVAMGDAAVALGGGILLSDANPALLGWMPAMAIEGLAPVAKGFDADSRLWQIGVASPARKEPFYSPAVGVVYRDYDLVATDGDLSATYSMNLSSFVLAAPLPKGITMGAAARRVAVSGLSGWYADLGATFQGRWIDHDAFALDACLGVAARRLGNDIDTPFIGVITKAPVFESVGGVAAAPVRPEMAWGGTMTLHSAPMHCTLALQVVDPMEAGTRGELYTHAGFEIAYGRWAALRAGIIDDEDFHRRFTYGGGIEFPVAMRWSAGADYAREPALPHTGLAVEDAPGASHFVSFRVQYQP